MVIPPIKEILPLLIRMKNNRVRGLLVLNWNPAITGTDIQTTKLKWSLGSGDQMNEGQNSLKYNINRN